MADQDDTVENTSKVKALPGGKQKLKLIPSHELKLNTSRRDLVKGILPQTGLAVVWGPPKCGKSFWITDILFHACLGWPYRGHKTQAGGVLYCAFEGQGGLAARKAAIMQRHLPHNPEIPFWFCKEVIDIIRDYKSLIVAVRDLPGQRVNAIVLDTLNKSLFGSENKDEDMSAYIRACDVIAETLQCLVVVVHHCGTAGNRPRGHTALTGAVDVQIKVSRKGETISAEVELAKDGPAGAVIVSTLEKVTVGTDEDGQPITTGLIVAPDVKSAREAQIDRLTPKVKAAFNCLCETIQTEGQKLPKSAALGITLTQYREALAKLKIINERGNPWEQVKRHLGSLKTARLIEADDELVWLLYSD